MLRHLKIQNLVLVGKAEINFGAGLNILTGETGAGKSAVLAAIRLIAGDRADTSLVGKNGDLAIVEAEMGGRTIRREIHRSGKSRCFIDEGLVSLTELRESCAGTIDFVDAEHAFALSGLETQRELFDAALGLTEAVGAFGVSFADEAALQKQLDALLQSQETRSRDLAWTEEDLGLIDEVAWKAGEEEALTQEHKMLVHAQELVGKLNGAAEIVSTSSMKRALALLESAAHLDAHLTPLTVSFKSALLEIDEVSRELYAYLAKFDPDPKRLEKVEERIGAIETLKRKFGKTVEEVAAKKKGLQERVLQLNHLDEEVKELRTQLQKAKETTHHLAQQLSEERKRGAPRFATQVLAQLHDLNLPHAQFHISLAPQDLATWGADAIHFLFSANPGHSPIPLEECASGGERARLLLAIKTVLAEREKRGCLIFDEIDSNVGGHTATALGEKLKHIAQNAQVICVTHFMQVAKCAEHHFAVSKNGGAITTITKLQEQGKAQEYQRMLGTL